MNKDATQRHFLFCVCRLPSCVGIPQTTGSEQRVSFFMTKLGTRTRNHRHNWKAKHVGTIRAYHASKKRTAVAHARNLWRVTGGESPHWVKRMDDVLLVGAGLNAQLYQSVFECDCDGFDRAKDHACTHVICVMRAIGMPLTKAQA